MAFVVGNCMWNDECSWWRFAATRTENCVLLLLRLLLLLGPAGLGPRAWDMGPRGTYTTPAA